MPIDHNNQVAQIMASNDRGDYIEIDPGTSETKRICGVLSHETVDINGVLSRVLIMRVAVCEAEYVPHGTVVKLTSDIHGLSGVTAEIKGNEYSDSGTIDLQLLARA